MSIASSVEQQIPSFIRSDFDVPFALFLDSYYRFLSESYEIILDDLEHVSISLLQNETEWTLNSEKGEVYHQLTSIKKLRDIDTTTVSLVSNFVSEYMDGVNAPSLDSIRHNMKLMKNFYENKGNENSFKFLFNLLYDEIVNISYPFEKALKLSETKWIEGKTSVRIDKNTIMNETPPRVITTEDLDLMIDMSIGNGVLKSYSSETIISDIDTSDRYECYKLIIEDLNINEPIEYVNIGSSIINTIKGLGEVKIWTSQPPGTGGMGGYDSSGVYPSDKLEIENINNAAVQYGARIEIDKMTEFELTNSNISGTPITDGRVEIVHDYFTVYEYDDNLTLTIVPDNYIVNSSQIRVEDAIAFISTHLPIVIELESPNSIIGTSAPDNAGNTPPADGIDSDNWEAGDTYVTFAGTSFTYNDVNQVWPFDFIPEDPVSDAPHPFVGNTIVVHTGELRLRGEVSGTTANIEKKELNRLWVSNIEGTFLSDYELNENGGSELVLILVKINDEWIEIGNLRFGRMYTACTSPATVIIKNGSVNVVQGGKGYIFNPYVKTNGLSIINLGTIEKVKINDMGIGYDDPTTAEPVTHIPSGSNQPYNLNYNINRIISPTGSSDGQPLKKHIGFGKSGKVLTENFIESTTLNTLDGEAKLRDGNYYQEFSYEIVSSVPMETWNYPVKKLLHPAGMKLFGKDITVTSPFDLSLTDKFPAWSDYSDGSDSLEIQTYTVFPFSYELSLGTSDFNVDYTTTENVSMNTYSSVLQGFGNFDTIVNYDDIISETHFARYDSSLAMDGSESISNSFQIVDYHVITENFQPETFGMGDGFHTFNNNTHSVKYKTLWNDNFYSVDSVTLDGFNVHLVMKKDELEALGENGENLLLSGFNIHEYKLDDILTKYEGDGLGTYNTNILVHEYIIRYSIDTNGDGVGDMEAIAFVYPFEYDTDIPKVEDESSTSSMDVTKYHSIPTYNTYFSGSGSEAG